MQHTNSDIADFTGDHIKDHEATQCELPGVLFSSKEIVMYVGNARHLFGSLLTEAELSLLIDIQNTGIAIGKDLDPSLVRRGLAASVEDGETYDKVCSKWDVDGPALVKKVKDMNDGQAIAIAAYALGWWDGVTTEQREEAAVK